MEKITHENWPESWQDVPSFTEISEDVYTDMLNVLPPVHLRQSPYCGFQMASPWIMQRMKTADGAPGS